MAFDAAPNKSLKHAPFSRKNDVQSSLTEEEEEENLFAK